MVETNQAAPADLAGCSRELIAELGLAKGAFGAVLFSLIDCLDAPFAIKEIASGRYVHANARAAALFGVLPEQLIGQTDTEILGSEMSAALRSAEQSALAQRFPFRTDHHIDRLARERQ